MEAGKQNFSFFFFAIVIFISEMSVLGGATGAEYIIIFYL